MKGAIVWDITKGRWFSYKINRSLLSNVGQKLFEQREKQKLMPSDKSNLKKKKKKKRQQRQKGHIY